MRRGGWTWVASRAAIDGDGDEEGQEEEGQPCITVGEQHGDGDNGAELADGTHRQDGGTDGGMQHAGVVQDREQRAQGRGSQAERHDRVVEHESRGMKEDADAERENQGRPPRSRCPSEVALAHGRKVEFGPRQEHQVGQAEIGQGRHDAVRVREVEHVGSEQDPEDDLDHHLRNGDEPARPFADDRCKHRRDPDEDQRWDGVFDHVSPTRPVTARCGTPRHLLGPRYAPGARSGVISEV